MGSSGLMDTGFPFGVMKMFWSQIEVMVQNLLNKLHVTGLFISQLLILCEFHLNKKRKRTRKFQPLEKKKIGPRACSERPFFSMVLLSFDQIMELAPKLVYLCQKEWKLNANDLKNRPEKPKQQDSFQFFFILFLVSRNI